MSLSVHDVYCGGCKGASREMTLVRSSYGHTRHGPDDYQWGEYRCGSCSMVVRVAVEAGGPTARVISAPVGSRGPRPADRNCFVTVAARITADLDGWIDPAPGDPQD